MRAGGTTRAQNIGRLLALAGTRQGRHGRKTYFGEPVLFSRADFPLLAGAAAAARFVAPRATRFRIWLIGDRSTVSEGALPRDLGARPGRVDELFRQLEELIRSVDPARAPMPGLLLYRGRQAVFALDDGDVPRVLLTPEEYRGLQDALEEHGFPRNLYYDAGEARTAIVDVPRYGRIVPERRFLSPGQWAEYGSQGPVEPAVVSAAEYDARFVEACEVFKKELLLRIARPVAAEHRGGAEEQEELGHLLVRVVRAQLRALGKDVSSLNEALKRDQRESGA